MFFFFFQPKTTETAKPATFAGDIPLEECRWIDRAVSFIFGWVLKI